jgi:hypothetical protein
VFLLPLLVGFQSFKPRFLWVPSKL